MSAVATLDSTTTVDLAGSLPDGDSLGDEMLMASGVRATANLKRATGSKGSKVGYEPRGWTMGGQVD